MKISYAEENPNAPDGKIISDPLSQRIIVAKHHIHGTQIPNPRWVPFGSRIEKKSKINKGGKRDHQKFSDSVNRMKVKR